MLIGLVMTFLLVGGVGVWAARTEIASAVIAQGIVVVETSVKKVQHPTGGVVGEIYVKNGDKVKAGDLLLRLDETVTRANLQVISKQLDELMGREARYKAERDSAPSIALPRAFQGRENEANVAEIISGERTLFESRRDSIEGQKAQLRERITQLKEEFQGITGQIEAKQREIELIGQEMSAMEELESKQLVPLQKRIALRRDAANLTGQLGALKASAAQTKGKVSEIELQILRIDQDFRSELMRELRDNQARQAEFSERRVAAEDQLKRVELRAPQSGIVHQMQVHTVGGVINPAEPAMLIVPENDRLVIDAKVAPHDIEQVLQAEKALIRFSAFNQRTTPELEGAVQRVSADLTHDQQTNESYFMVRLAIPEAELAKLGDKRLVPGMPADVQIRTQYRTALSYLLKPLEDQISKAFRER
jgi:HlyD family secretion protein